MPPNVTSSEYNSYLPSSVCLLQTALSGANTGVWLVLGLVRMNNVHINVENNTFRKKIVQIKSLLKSDILHIDE